MSAATNTINEIIGDVTNLSHLLNTIIGGLCEVDLLKVPDTERADINRLSALLWIGRDLCERIEATATDCHKLICHETLAVRP